MNPVVQNIYEQPGELRGLAESLRSRTLPGFEELSSRLGQPPHKTILTGMGASYFSLFPAAAEFDRIGRPVMVEETAKLLEFFSSGLDLDALVIAVSQSGESVESKRLAELPRRFHLAAVVRDPESPLGRSADSVLSMGVTGDHSVAMKTYMGSLTLLVAMALGQSGCKALPSVVKAIETTASVLDTLLTLLDPVVAELAELVSDRQTVTLLGRYVSYASALEGALLFREVAKRAAQGEHAGQFRHGAIEQVDDRHVVFLFKGGEEDERDRRLAGRLLESGAGVVTVSTTGARRAEPSLARRGALCEVTLPRAPLPALNPLIEILPLQLLSVTLAARRGIEPGIFRNTTPVIATD